MVVAITALYHIKSPPSTHTHNSSALLWRDKDRGVRLLEEMSDNQKRGKLCQSEISCETQNEAED